MNEEDSNDYKSDVQEEDVVDVHVRQPSKKDEDQPSNSNLVRVEERIMKKILPLIRATQYLIKQWGNEPEIIAR